MRQSDWDAAQRNRTYWAGSLSDSEGRNIKWHSPSDETSSQVFCVSALGGLRTLLDFNRVLSALFREALPDLGSDGPWELTLEYTRRELLGETGQGTPTNVDAFCDSPAAVVCVESKFLHDAVLGFGGCGQVAKRKVRGTIGPVPQSACAGHYGPASDLRTGTSANCRLTVAEGRRDPRKYWDLGRTVFRESVFREQAPKECCLFKGPNFQLMRNFLFAKEAATNGRNWGVVILVPEKTASRVRTEVRAFRDGVVAEPYRDRIGVATYEVLVRLLSESSVPASRDLGTFLDERIGTLLEPLADPPCN